MPVAPRRIRAVAPALCALLAATLAACGESGVAADEANQVKQRAKDAPNVLFVMTDDQRNGQMGFMPKTRKRLGGKGTTFTNAYVTTPLCCPSRASIYSGKYAHNTGVTGNGAGGTVAHWDQEETWPELLREGGYYTGLAGKFLNHWDRDEKPPIFDFYDWADGAAAKEANKRIDDLRAEAAHEFFDKVERRDRRPWALAVSLHAPHTAFDPPRKYRDFDAGPPPRNAATRERDISDKPDAVRDQQETKRHIAKSWTGQAQTLRAADDIVDGLLRKLRRNGELEDTLVIFTSDNGFMTGEHGISKKVWPYLPSIGVPMIVSWPGEVEPGARNRDIVANIDIAPTILDAAGIEPDYELDGRSLLSSQPPREWLLLEGPRQGPRSPYPPWDAYLDRETHYIEWHDDEGWRELYDLTADPFEVESLLAGDDPDAEELAKEYAAKVEQGRTCAGSECP
jgi:arylsulfatase A-like enzyme